MEETTGMTDTLQPTRRSVLAALAAGAGVLAVAPGITLVAPAAAQGAPASVRWGLLIEANKCRPGCSDCTTACATEMGLPDTGNPLTDPHYVRIVQREGKGQVPVMCQHCANPPCVDVCPTTASFQRDDGIVLVDRHRCIGCRYCMMACPYGARSFCHEDASDQKPWNPRGKGTVESCTMCVHRLDAGRTPACVDACPEGAILSGDLNDPDSAISRRLSEVATIAIRADLGTAPGVRYTGL